MISNCLFNGQIKLALFFLPFYKTMSMNKEHKNRSGSQSNDGSSEQRGDKKQTSQPGASVRSNRQTGHYEKDNSSRGSERNTAKKGPNSI